MELIKALSKVQQELRAPKNCYNDFAKFSYRNAEAILEAVKPLLVSYNLVLIMTDDMINLGDRYYLKATVKLMLDKETIEVSALAREELSLKGQIAAQISGGCSSYARKYALSGLFCIDDEKDPDSNEHHNNAQNNNTSQPQKEEPKWYNDFDKQKAQMLAKIKSGEQTAQGIIDSLKGAGFALSKKTQDQIKGLK